jgi:hypothetical protein
VKHRWRLHRSPAANGVFLWERQTQTQGLGHRRSAAKLSKPLAARPSMSSVGRDPNEISATSTRNHRGKPNTDHSNQHRPLAKSNEGRYVAARIGNEVSPVLGLSVSQLQASHSSSSTREVLIMKRFRSNKFLPSSIIGAGLLLGLTGCFAATPAFAGQTAEQACTPDVMRLCQQFVPDHARIAACLWKNTRHLSPACRTVMSSAKKKRKQRHASR